MFGRILWPVLCRRLNLRKHSLLGYVIQNLVLAPMDWCSYKTKKATILRWCISTATVVRAACVEMAVDVLRLGLFHWASGNWKPPRRVLIFLTVGFWTLRFQPIINFWISGHQMARIRRHIYLHRPIPRNYQWQNGSHCRWTMSIRFTNSTIILTNWIPDRPILYQ